MVTRFRSGDKITVDQIDKIKRASTYSTYVAALKICFGIGYIDVEDLYSKEANILINCIAYEKETDSVKLSKFQLKTILSYFTAIITKDRGYTIFPDGTYKQHCQAYFGTYTPMKDLLRKDADMFITYCELNLIKPGRKSGGCRDIWSSLHNN